MFRPGREGGPPNNWPSNWGGPAWTLDEESGEWYLHLFAPEQPDLDWHTPAVPESFEGIVRFWFDRGVDGLRVDVAHGLFKDATLADEQEPFPDSRFAFDWRRAIDQPEVHGVYRAWRRIATGYSPERVLVGEVTFTDPVRIAPYLRKDELHMAFNFTLLFEPWDADSLRDGIDSSRAALAEVGAPPTWVLENHDVTRLPSRYGSLDRARAAALLLLALPGPVFLYQGQELGLEEVDLPDEARQDPIFRRTNGARKGRDGCRVPMPWEGAAPPFGFTGGTPWLPIPAAWAEKTVERQDARPVVDARAPSLGARAAETADGRPPVAGERRRHAPLRARRRRLRRQRRRRRARAPARRAARREPRRRQRSSFRATRRPGSGRRERRGRPGRSVGRGGAAAAPPRADSG